MPADQILQEARKLRRVSDSLDVMAEQDAPISEELALLSGSVRNFAIVLEVLVALWQRRAPEYDPLIN
jgi:hypothetical protein